MTVEEYLQKVRSIAMEFGTQQKDVDRDANFFSEGIFDSLVAIDYLIRIEEEFGISLTMEIVTNEKLGTITAMATYLFNAKRK